MKDDSFFWVEESSGQFCLPVKRKRQRLKKLEFIGWGSKPLIEFLESIGKDTSKPLNRYEVAAIVNEYVNARNLANPIKRKKITCDQWLLALFGKRSVSRIKIYDLLENHFTENRDSSEEDSQYSSDEQDYGSINVDKTAPNLDGRPSCQKIKIPENLSSHSAAICFENIKLVYLKQTLLLDLLKSQENFSVKVIGSFVRIRSDPNDRLQKNSYQLQQVIGVRMIYEAVSDGKVHLQLSNRVDDIPVEMLSDDNFLEAECEDLRQRIKAGSLTWPTFVELEAKARMLHKDIMKHWIPRQLSLLQNLIDRANEKGWRREFFDYLEQRELLEKSSEQERLIAEIPKVIVDKLQTEAMPLDKLEMGEVDCSSPESFNWEASDNYYSDDDGSGKVKLPSAIIRGSSIVSETENSGINTGVANKEAVNGNLNAGCQNSNIVQNGNAATEKGGEIGNLSAGCQNSNIVQNGNAATEKGDESSRGAEQVSPGKSEVKLAPVIELSDDDEFEAKMEKDSTADDPVWQYVDPQGIVQGPFSLISLKRWHDANYFNPSFMVWKNDQSRDQAVLLIDVLQCAFPHK